jgi:hypothetical protein
MAATDQKTISVLDSGTYEIIRNRLNEQRIELAARLAKLNTARQEVFSSDGFELIANQRITTENHAASRGIIAMGDLCIFGYNVQFGLKEDIKLSDVFSIYKFANDYFEPHPLTLIDDPAFVTDFTNLYKYYRDSLFARFFLSGNYLYMIFQTGKTVEDRKSFKWLIKNNQLTYIDDRSIHEVQRAPQHDFRWIKSSLEDRRLGAFPHISILDKVFIEAINGDITFKVENNTASGRGIYHEPVLNKDQQLDDAEYYYADLGNLVAVKIKPYQEEARCFIFNARTREVKPIKMLLDAGILLPDNQGVIFPNGYYLQNGDYKLFESDLTGLEFIRSVPSPNGEDILYIFYQVHSNTYVLMSYNIIVQQVETPIICNGFTVFHDGKLIYFRTEAEAVRHHQVQIWQTPYTVVLKENDGMHDNVLYKIGNKDIVSAMSESQEIIQLLSKEDSYSRLYEDIQKKANDVIDSYFWIRDPATFDLATPLSSIKDIANTAIDEFAKVQAQRKHAREALAAMQKRVDQLVIDIKNNVVTSLDQLVQMLANTWNMQGAVIDLRNVKYVALDKVEELQKVLDVYNTTLSQDTINFLLKDKALEPYEQKVIAQKSAVTGVTKAIDALAIEAAVKGIAGELEMLIDILNSLKIEDTTQSTRIIEKISLIFASLNEVKADLARTLSSLRSKEATGEFYAQLTLLEQGIVSFLDLSTSPEKCEDYFTKVSVQVEELESKFADFPDFVLKIADKRDEVIKAFNGKKEMLISQINKRSASLEQIGLRVLKNVENKARSFDSKESIYAFFSADLMIGKIRGLVADLAALGDVAKSENLENLLKVAQEDALRNLKDKTDLFVDGQNIIALGDYKFVVNKQVLDLSIVRKDERLFFHLTGTSFYKEVTAEALYQYRFIWEQELISENTLVYRGEYLAYQTYRAYESLLAGLTSTNHLDTARMAGDGKAVISSNSVTIGNEDNAGRRGTAGNPGNVGTAGTGGNPSNAGTTGTGSQNSFDHISFTNDKVERDYAASYLKGVHNSDAILIFEQLRALREGLGILNYPPAVRVAAQMFWLQLDEATINKLSQLIAAAHSIEKTFPGSRQSAYVVSEIVSKYRLYAGNNIRGGNGTFDNAIGRNTLNSLGGFDAANTSSGTNTLNTFNQTGPANTSSGTGTSNISNQNGASNASSGTGTTNASAGGGTANNFNGTGTSNNFSGGGTTNRPNGASSMSNFNDTGTAKTSNAGDKAHPSNGSNTTNGALATSTINNAAAASDTSVIADPVDIAEYLYNEFAFNLNFTASEQAIRIKKGFNEFMQAQKRLDVFVKDTENAGFSLEDRFQIIKNWLHAFLQQRGFDVYYIDEAACLLLFKNHPYKERAGADNSQINGLKGTHAVIAGQLYQLYFHSFLAKMENYASTIVPAFEAFNKAKSDLTKTYKHALKIGEFEPRVLSSFVRNRLINETYFPLIGSNLAKQIGAAGDDKRTARMGMLLLISPPGYGKTTLMEYLAKTMGLHFVKINGPSIGHRITSIDPVEATTSGAREELKKINLAFEMADNVMLYLDDIQHCSPEFLQKFISLADGQRKMDGIFEGDSKTYDLRGKRFCVVMAGNPYTESGEQFKIPDMLANRADVYNLGDVIGTSDHLFNLSLIENAVAENRYLQKISNRSFEDLHKLISYIETSAEMLPALEGNYQGQEVEDALAVLRSILTIRDLVIRVNQQYIASAAMKEAYRTEPAFKLQGSYRNMNKMVGKVVPLMNITEVRTLILTHYESESQTLSSDAEANLLKLKELGGYITAPEFERWEQIKAVFRKNNKFGGVDQNDTSGQMLIQLSNFNEHLEAIAKALINI